MAPLSVQATSHGPCQISQVNVRTQTETATINILPNLLDPAHHLLFLASTFSCLTVHRADVLPLCTPVRLLKGSPSAQSLGPNPPLPISVAMTHLGNTPPCPHSSLSLGGGGGKN